VTRAGVANNNPKPPGYHSDKRQQLASNEELIGIYGVEEENCLV